jgi:hypothetical protein
MKIATHKIISVGILILGVAVINSWVASAQDDHQSASEVIRTQRKIYIEKTMEFTSQEKESFWPLYTEYESGLSKIRGKRIALATRIFQKRGIFSDDEAITMLKQRMKIDVDELKYKLSYVSKFMKVLSGRKVARFYQTENRLDTAATAELYSNIPVIR